MRDRFLYAFWILLYLVSLILYFLLGYKTASKIILENHYSNAFIVTDVDRESNLVTITSPTGFTYQFIGCEDWSEGDICVATMDNMKTENVIDDKVIRVQYAGTADDFILR